MAALLALELLMLQVTENCCRQMLTDAIMLHLISHRPQEAVEKLQKMAAGDGVEIEAGACCCLQHSLLAITNPLSYFLLGKWHWETMCCMYRD